MKFPILALLLLVSPLRAGELVPSQIPAAAKWQLHADLDAIRASQTGKALFARLEADHGTRFRAFKRMFSLHPLTDLRGVTIYGDGKPERAVALLDGTFVRAHLEDVVKAADGYREDRHAGFTVHTWQDKGIPQHAAFARDHLLVFSRDPGLLRLALDTLKAGAPAAQDPFFAADGGPPLLAASARLAEIEMPGDEARLVRMARTLRLAAGERDGRFSVRMAAETADATDADRLRRMLDGMIAFAQAGEADLDGLDLRSEVTASPEPPSMAGMISLPAGEWIRLMEKLAAKVAP